MAAPFFISRAEKKTKAWSASDTMTHKNNNRKKAKKVTKKEAIDSKEFAIQAARIALELNSKDVMVVDLRGISPATDFFVIATSSSNRQGRTVVDDIAVFAKAHGYPRFGMAGHEQGQWILADFVDVVVHVFDEEYRNYYELETLWGDAKQLELPEFEKPHAPHAQPEQD